MGRKQDAMAALKQAVELDVDYELDFEDKDLTPLRKLPEFKDLFKEE